MSFILKSHHDRYKERTRENIYRSITTLALVIVAVIIGYYIGDRKNEQDARQIQINNQTLKEISLQNEKEKSNLEAQYQILQVQHQQLQEKFERLLPQGESAYLCNLIQEQLERGMNPRRLEQVIHSTEPPQNCSEAQSKRFILSTPIYKGPQSAVTFSDGAIIVSGTGEPSINNKRNKEAWFDPGKPITMVFNIVGGQKEEKTGLLPLTHSLIHQNREYRFTISEGPRSFVVVTSDSCDYRESVMKKPDMNNSKTILTPIETSLDQKMN